MKRSLFDFVFLPSAQPAQPRPAIVTRERGGGMKDMLRGAALASLMAVAATAHAAEFIISGNIGYSFSHPGQVVLEQYDVTAPISVGRGVTNVMLGEKDFHAQAESLAENRGLHAHTFTQVIHQVSGGVPPSTDGGLYDANAYAQVTFHDFWISGPLGATTPVQSAINLHLSGQQSVSSFIPPVGHGGGGSESSVPFFHERQ